jgi:hypothetical protein
MKSLRVKAVENFKPAHSEVRELLGLDTIQYREYLSPV